MIAMELKNEQAERLGEAWIQAITEGELDQLEQFCQPDVNSLMIIPKGLVTLGNAVDLIAKFRQWFGTCKNFQVEEKRVRQIVNRAGEWLGIFYRFHLQEQDTWFVVEQQLYCTLKDGRVEKLHLLCSGFQPVGLEIEEQEPARDELLEFYSAGPEAGSTCALLTPAIRMKLREMQAGQILEVCVDDPSARSDIEAWSRLSGNALLKVIENEGPVLRFFVRKK